MKASKELNDRFGASEDDSGLRVNVFLRSDIYDDLRFDDKDKHRATEEHILWKPELLREMVERRLPKDVSVDELFEPGEMRGSKAPFDYIVKRTFLRPREVLQFLDECLRKAPRDAIVITKENVRAAEERYSSWKVADLKQEFAKVFPDLTVYLSAFAKVYIDTTASTIFNPCSGERVLISLRPTALQLWLKLIRMLDYRRSPSRCRINKI